MKILANDKLNDKLLIKWQIKWQISSFKFQIKDFILYLSITGYDSMVEYDSQ